MDVQPSSTLTLLFTDIEGSTRLLQRLGATDYARLLGEHHRLVRSHIAACQGVEVKTEGDSFFAVFPSAGEAITAAVRAQLALAGVNWPQGLHVGVRMGIHTGEMSISEGEYVGLDIHRAARISSAAHGGQVLLSAATRSLLGDQLPEGAAVLDLGEHRLKDLDRAEHIFQLVIPGLPSQFPPIHALAKRFEILPAEQTSFVGREAELARARELLAGTRLLTLTGPGGTGKTRLSLRLARAVAAEFDDGVAFVALAPISEAELVAPTIRQTLGLAEEPGRPATATLLDQLAPRNVLLVLDNFEQVAAAAQVVGQLMEGTEHLKVLVTSRTRLHLTGEQEFPVPPLELPPAGAVDDLEALSQSEAVALFMQRARTVKPDFQLSAGNARAIVEICARLDGLPLAIELAASRIKLLPPQALLDRLEHRLDLLQSTAADRTDRQRTLRGAIAWSYELLDEDERTLFRRLAIFVGGWRLEDSEQVVRTAGPLVTDVLDGLGRLLDHSLVRQLGDEAEARFGMLETIREYALEQLVAQDELTALASAHAGHFASLAEQAEPHLTAATEWLDRLDQERDNLRTAVAWLADHDIDRALLMSGAVWRFWHLRGHLREGSALLADLLARPSAAVPSAARAKALIGYAGLVYWMTDYAPARRSYEEALGIAQVLGDEKLQTEVLYSLAYVQAIERDWDGALRSFRESLAIHEALGATLGAAWAQMGIGMVTHLRGEHDQALPFLDEAEAKFRQLNNAFGLRNTISNSGRALMHLGRLDEARRVNREYISTSHSDNDPTALSTSLVDAAALDALEGDLARSARLVGAAQRIVEESGGQPPPELIYRVEPLPLLRQRLPEAELDALMAEGRRLAVDEAVSLALAERAG